MVNFGKSVRKSGKRTFYFHDNCVQQCKQYKSYKDKTFLRDLQMHMYCIYCKNVSSIEVAIQELSWGGGGGVGWGESRNQGVGQKHIGKG